MSWNNWRSSSEMPKKSENYNVELTGHTRYFSMNGEKGNKYTAVEMYDTNPERTEWIIYDKKAKK